MEVLPVKLFPRILSLLRRALPIYCRKMCAVIGITTGPVCRIAVAAGGGNMTSDMRAAVELGCDTYVTGEYALYSQQYAGFCGMNLFVGSHTNTEILGVKSMAERLTCGGRIELIRIREPND